MKKIKNVILGVIVLILASSIIACDKPKEEKKVVELNGKITVWVSKEDDSVLIYAASLFMKKHPKVKIEIEAKAGSEFDKNFADAKQAKQKLPDIITLNDINVAKFINKHENQLMEVSSVSGFSKDAYISGQITNSSVKNKIYALPWYVNPTVAVYREDLLKASNLKSEDIKTWEQYNDIGKDKYVSNGKGMLALSSLKDGELYNAGLSQLGINYYDENGKLDLLNKTNIRPAAVYYDMYQSKIFYDDSKDGGELQAFSNGNVISLLCDINTLYNIEKKYPALSGKLDVEKLPAFEEGGNRNAISYGTNILAMKGTVNNKAAVEFMKFLTMDGSLAAEEFKKYGYIASDSRLWENDAYFKKSAFYGNEALGKITVDVAEGLKDVKYSEDYETINTSMLSSLVDSATSNKSLNDSILNLEKTYENASISK